MQLGVVWPQTDISTDPGAVRAFAQGVEELGFDHVLIYDHVLGADPAGHPGWSGFFDVDSHFHEPFVLFGYLAALTRLELLTGIIILPQRQTALVAKQSAEIDILTGGRFRLGVGIGWNAVEYEALGMPFAHRGRRMDEQIVLLRHLWTERAVTFRGAFETVTAAGISPLPVQRPIPIWLGGNSLPAFRRIGRLADGWIPERPPGPDLDEAIAQVHSFAAEAGREPASIGLQGRIRLSADLETAASRLSAWRAADATHVALNTIGLGPDVDQHLTTLAWFQTSID
jgi:probable F420-dependent oxidoreductase